MAPLGSIAMARLDLVFLESPRPGTPSDSQIRTETIKFGDDGGAVIARRRPDLLLVRVDISSASDSHEGSPPPMVSQPSAERADEMPGRPLSDTLRAEFAALRGHDRYLPLIVTLPAEVQASEWVVAAIEAGATDVVSAAAPADQLRERIRLAIERRRLQRRPTIRTTQPSPNSDPAADSPARAIIGSSEVMLSILCRVAQFALDPAPMLVHGEPGTGKSLLALTLLRQARPTPERPLIVDCGQFAAEMLDRLLFDDASGRVQLRDEFSGQSLILENVDQADSRVQRRLLAAIRSQDALLGPPQTPESSPSLPMLVMTCSTPVDVARHNPVAGERTCGMIDELLFELSGYAIEMPPLRNRGNDVRKLIEHFIRSLTGTAPVDETGGDHRITEDAKSALVSYHWPGNVTQLRSVLASELRLGGGTIALNDRLARLLGSRGQGPQLKPVEPLPSRPISLPSEPQPQELNSPAAWATTVERFVANAATSDEPPALYGETIHEVEAGLISAVLEKTQGNLAQAARLLGITRVSLRRKIHSLGLQIPGRTPNQPETTGEATDCPRADAN